MLQISITVIILLFLMAITCPGCRKEFEASSGLSAHKRHCIKLSAKTVSVLEKRARDHHDINAAQVRVQRQRLGNGPADASEVRRHSSGDHEEAQSENPEPLVCFNMLTNLVYADADTKELPK